MARTRAYLCAVAPLREILCLVACLVADERPRQAEFFGGLRKDKERLRGADADVERVVAEELDELAAAFVGAAIAGELGGVGADGRDG